jgi:hypothetical protein
MPRLHTVFIQTVNTACIHKLFSAQQFTMGSVHLSFERLLACAKVATANRAPEQRVHGEPDLQRLLNWTPQQRTNFKKRGVSKQAAIDAESLLGCPAAFVRDGLNPPHWMQPQRSFAGEPAALYGVAYDLSQSPLQAVPLLDREQLLTHKPPELFRFTAPDDAMAPEVSAGTEIVWTTRRRVAPGRLVLLADSHQQLHVRRCLQGDGPAAWTFAPQNPAYRAFRSDEAGVQLIAVFKGRLEPDDD